MELSDHEPLGRLDAAAGERMALLQIANGIAQLHKVTFGRGPANVTVNYAGANVVLACLEGVLTSPERRLLELGEYERVLQPRLVLQQTLEEPVRGFVEQCLGRRTLAFVTGIDLRSDIATQVVTLVRQQPAGAGGVPAENVARPRPA